MLEVTRVEDPRTDIRAAVLADLADRLDRYTGTDLPVPAVPDDRIADPVLTLCCHAIHHRQPLEITPDALAAARLRLDRFHALLADLRAGGPAPEPSNVCFLEETTADGLERRFLDALGDDFDTPAALDVLEEVAEGRGEAAGLHPGRAAAMLGRWAAILGIRP